MDAVKVTTQNSRKKEEERSKKAPALNPDREMRFTFRDRVITESIARIIEENMINWYNENPNARSFREFRLKHDYTRQTLSTCINKFPWFKRTYKEIGYNLGEYLIDSTFDGQMTLAPSSGIKLRLRHYSEEFTEDMREVEKIKAEAQAEAEAASIRRIATQIAKENEIAAKKFIEKPVKRNVS